MTMTTTTTCLAASGKIDDTDRNVLPVARRNFIRVSFPFSFLFFFFLFFSPFLFFSQCVESVMNS